MVSSIKNEELLPRLLILENFFKLPQFEFPEIQKNLYSSYASNAPSHFYCVIISALCDFQYFKLNISKLQMPHCAQQCYLLDKVIDSSAK